MAGVSTLVSARWLAEKIASGTKGIRIVDCSWYLPVTGKKAYPDYVERHIPGAVFFDIDECCDKTSKMDHMLPPPEVFESFVGKLGINNNTHVVLYDNNEKFGIFSVQRVWWTFKVFGHQAISIVNGGLPKWFEGGFEITKDIPKIQAEKYKANFNPGLVKSFEDIQANLKSAEYQVIDARPAGRFNGTSPEPRPDIKPGHIPGSVNIPFMNIMDPKTKTVKSPEELKKLFEAEKIDLEKPLIASCGSGVTACCLVLAASLCGRENLPVYDGAWTEWFQKAKPEQMVNCPKD